MGLALPNALHCSAGHHIRENAFIFDAGGLRCTHRGGETNDARGGQRVECGRLIYVVRHTDVFEDAGLKRELAWYAEVSYEEMRRFQERRFAPLQVMFALGAIWPMPRTLWTDL